MALTRFSFSFVSLVDVNAAAKYTDCESPPTILHGKTELIIDDEGIRVSAIYSCENGFQLVGATELLCDIDTDEWQGDLPACSQGNCPRVYFDFDGK